jgi:hypothetical protein
MQKGKGVIGSDKRHGKETPSDTKTEQRAACEAEKDKENKPATSQQIEKQTM